MQDRVCVPSQVDPWKVTGVVDYDKLINDFGFDKVPTVPTQTTDLQLHTSRMSQNLVSLANRLFVNLLCILHYLHKVSTD